MACCQMLVQVRLLCKARVASHERGVRAPEGPLSSVRAQMVQEIVQLREHLFAGFDVTLKELLLSGSSRIAVFEDPKRARGR